VSAKSDPDRRDEINVLVLTVFFVVVLIPSVIVGTIDELLQAPPLQGRLCVIGNKKEFIQNERLKDAITNEWSPG